MKKNPAKTSNPVALRIVENSPPAAKQSGASKASAMHGPAPRKH
jgi:hypothetical protein